MVKTKLVHVGDTNGKMILFFIVLNDNDDDDDDDNDNEHDPNHCRHHHLLLFTHNYHAIRYHGLQKPHTCNFRVVSNSFFPNGVGANS